MDDTLTMSVESDKRTRTRSPNREQPDDTVSAALPQLSNELTDRILDYLHDDVPTLKNCSLTCRSFLQRSRFNLFRIISVNIRNVQKFCDLLGEVPQLGIYVRELRVLPLATLHSSPNELRLAQPRLTQLRVSALFVNRFPHADSTLRFQSWRPSEIP